MSKLLAVDTSGPVCTLAVHVAGRWFENTQFVDRLHNLVLLEMLDSLIRTAGIEPRSLDAVAFSAGPGSFTGIRIAAALAQAVAYAAGARVIAVPSSQALAAQALVDLGADRLGNSVVTVTRSRRDAYYVATYGFRAGVPEQIAVDQLYLGTEAPPDLVSTGTSAVGDRPDWWSQLDPQPEFHTDLVVRAPTIGRLALKALDQGQGSSDALALPIYVRGDSPWRRIGDTP
ncbi:MAG: tRNA (adenosine(37)-N6)-threonylcarbamoyltransferase complex dimerization subunit type 1 TsaB [Pseudomonadales bacterium]